VERADILRLISQQLEPVVKRLQRLEGRVIEVDGDPNGTVDAAGGRIAVDATTPASWKKTTPLGTTTGWVAL
jgi:hypothetical protein